jgi:Tol biopolymer transport system component
MNADATGFVQLTHNAVFDGGPNFSPDGQKILFIRSLGPARGQELFVMNADGTNECN